MSAWICPKCGRVWGPYVMECVPCNTGKPPIAPSTGTGFAGLPEKHQPKGGKGV